MAETYNAELRIYMGGIKQVDIATELGYASMTISRWFNEKEMDYFRYMKVKNAIDAIREREEKARQYAVSLTEQKAAEFQRQQEQQRELQIGR